MISNACERPAARAYDALNDLDLGPELVGDDDSQPSLEFNSGSNPCSCDQWVEATDVRAMSLLQARLLELGRPFRLVRGEFS